MRTFCSPRQRFDGSTMDKVPLNLNCHDEIIPILAALRYIHLIVKTRHRTDPRAVQRKPVWPYCRPRLIPYL